MAKEYWELDFLVNISTRSSDNKPCKKTLEAQKRLKYLRQ